MILTRGRYDMQSGRFFITFRDVEEKPKTYKSEWNSFRKDEEEKVRYLNGDFYSPYLEVYTTDSNNPEEKVKNLVADWFGQRIEELNNKNRVFINSKSPNLIEKEELEL